MDKFIIKRKNAPDPCTTMTIRIEKELLAAYDELASKYGTSRTDLVVQAMKFALEHLEEK